MTNQSSKNRVLNKYTEIAEMLEAELERETDMAIKYEFMISELYFSMEQDTVTLLSKYARMDHLRAQFKIHDFIVEQLNRAIDAVGVATKFTNQADAVNCMRLPRTQKRRLTDEG